ncbi:hypothetical protein DLM78_20275 [Leptospira stimsonii]|uniref:Uncharacterized protein n=1 Tax=Leptospira stimsonii TaxID=2202203 RepID=A0A8B3CKN3_9LEPT|nr:hypothetical protein DLM78_20275 [Leptospira stimsonii]
MPLLSLISAFGLYGGMIFFHQLFQDRSLFRSLRIVFAFLDDSFGPRGDASKPYAFLCGLLDFKSRERFCLSYLL